MLKSIFRDIQRRVEDVAAQKKGVNREINYLNWWPCNYNERQWFNEFLIHRNVLEPGLPNQITMTSVMGPRYMNKIAKKGPLIFFTAEDTEYRYTDYDDYMINEADFALGFKTIQAENYLRFPLWMMYSLSPFNVTQKKNNQYWYSISDFIDKVNNIERFDSRPYFASLIARHDHRGNGAGLRTSIVQKLNKVGKVHCAGQLLNNTNELHEKFKNNILNYLEIFHFNICLENTDSPGYTTEKLFQSLVAGSIPIYWGSSNNPEPEILTGNGIVFIEKNDLEEPAELIQKLYKDKKFRRDFQSKPIFTPDAQKILESRYDTLASLVKKLKTSW